MSNSSAFQAVFGEAAPVIGMVHLLPLPGSARWGGAMTQVLDRARRDAAALLEGGASGVVVENFGDAPFRPDSVGAATVAAMTLGVEAVQAEVGNRVPVGVNVLRNDAAAALGIAAATDAAFIRVNVHTGAMVTDQGVIEGLAHETLVLRRLLGAPTLILADVLSKHAAPLGSLTIEQAARDTWERGLADGLIVTGAATGLKADLDDVRRVRAAAPDAPVLVGSGVTAETVAAALRVADGVIVGTSVKVGGITANPVDPGRVRALVTAARNAAGG